MMKIIMMRNTIILAVCMALVFAASCKKVEENIPSEEISGGAVITAVAGQLGAGTKVEMAYRYDLLWQTDDQIYVTDGHANDTFTLIDGAGTTKGTFTQDGTASLSGEVQAYYPGSLVSGNNLVWPAVQTMDQTVPMYSSATLSGTDDERMDFTSLGSVLQIVFNSVQDDVTLQKIIIRDGSKPMSGPFYVDDNGKAIITATNVAGITMDLGAGKVLGKGANYFNLAVPAGKYNDVTISFITSDMHVCTMHSGTLPEIEHNTVCRITLTGTKFGNNTLPGAFSVGEGRVVEFSRGNLFWDGDSYEFEANQLDFPTSRAASHMGHFFWSNDPEVARASSYSDPNRGEHDVFFTNAAEYSANPDFTVGDITGRFRTLSMLEWKYLFDSRSNAKSLYKVHVTVCGKAECLVIAPDNYNGGAIKESYSEEEWQEAEAQGLVCLPAAGYFYMSNAPVQGVGHYWSSAPWTKDCAQSIFFLSGTIGVGYSDELSSRFEGYTVRLVRDKEFVTGVELDRTAMDLSLRQSVKLAANVLPSNAPRKNVVWTSDNPDVATVAADGTVTGVSVGTATITVTTENASKTASCTVTVQPHYAGIFSVSSDKKVRFSRGNLFWDGDSYEFEANQHDFPTSRAASHMGHFFWSNDPVVARASSYSDPNRGEHDVFFTNATEPTANPNFTVSGITGRFRTLSMLEWKYLFESRSDNLHKIHVKVCGQENCLVIAPDNFQGNIKESYNATEWQAAEAQGLVCLPPAGYLIMFGDLTAIVR